MREKKNSEKKTYLDEDEDTLLSHLWLGFSYLKVLILLQFLRQAPNFCAPTSVNLLYVTLSNTTKHQKLRHISFKCNTMLSSEMQ